MKRDILLAGVGGQGTVLVSKLIAEAAMERGHFVRTAETIGMAQRGGSVTSHVRIGDSAFSPLLERQSADLLVGFEPAEAVRSFPYVKPGGAIVASDRAIPAVGGPSSGAPYDGGEMLAYLREHAATVLIVRAEDAARELGSMKPLNMVLLGAACGCGALGFLADDMTALLPRLVNKTFLDMNRRAILYGDALAKRARDTAADRR